MPRRSFFLAVAGLFLLGAGSFGPMTTVPAQAADSMTAQPVIAHWIWAPTTSANQWVAFRKTFTLATMPTTADTRIAVDTKYWLYVNGQLAIFEGGLKRGPNPTDTYYDEKDLVRYLHTGTNTIAVLVWHFGKSGFSHQDSGAGGLIMQLHLTFSDHVSNIASNTTWKARVHPGYVNDTTGSQPYYTLAESNVFYDARLASSMQNWQTPGYNDQSWSAAVDKGPAGAAPWNGFVKRPIPFFKYSALQAYANASSLPAYGTGAPISAKLPSDLQVTPYLKVDAPSGAVISIQTDYYMDGGQPSVRSTYVTTGGVQEFESLGWMAGTAVQYTIPAKVHILALEYRESGYDTTFAGSFTSDDAFLNKLWGKAARTMYVDMRDNYMDCPTRERAQWWGDAVNEIKEGFYTFDPSSYAQGKKAISQLVDWQRSSGVLYSPIPGNSPWELPSQMLTSVWSFWTYYMYTGHKSAIVNTYPAIKRYLNLWTLDGDGLVNHRTGDWDWYDWGGNIDPPVEENAWYYMALDTAIKIAGLTGNTGDISSWQARRTSIANNFNRVFWKSSAGEYRSPSYYGDPDDRAGALAVIAGLADPSQYPAIQKLMSTHQYASPYMEFYILQALYMMDVPQQALDRMHARYMAQVNDPSYTLWEFWDKSGTLDHAWNGGPLYVLSAYAVGVRPTQPGYSEFQITPQLGSLTSVKSVVPTIRGPITVDLQLSNAQSLRMKVDSPKGTRARIAVPRLGMSKSTIRVNGVVVYANGAPAKSLARLNYQGLDASYIYFTVQSGHWNITETR